jgi:hypothetical protein
MRKTGFRTEYCTVLKKYPQEGYSVTKAFTKLAENVVHHANILKKAK